MAAEEAVVVGRARRERIQARKNARKAASVKAHVGATISGAGSRRQRAAEKKKARKASKANTAKKKRKSECYSEDQQPKQRRHPESRKRSREGSPVSQAAPASSTVVTAPASSQGVGAKPTDVFGAAKCTTLFYDGCDDEISAATAAALAESGVITDETLVWSEDPAFDFQGYTPWEECSYVFGVGEPPEADDTIAATVVQEPSTLTPKKAETDALDPFAGQLQPVTKYPYPVDDADHCETPAEAYADVAPVLYSLARQLGKSAANLKIWDPYFCQGRVKQHLAALGFTDVHNECEDFYARLRAQDLPEHDVLLTNPPYSSDHLQKIIHHVTTSGKPWLMLVPNFVYMKEYYRSATRRVLSVPSRAVAPFYIAPYERYYYYSPKGLEITGANGKVRKSGETKTSPFMSFWYIGGFGVDGTDTAVRDWRADTSKAAKADGEHAQPRCKLAQSMAALPQHVMDRNDPNRRRLNRTEREKRRKKVSKSGVPLCKQCGQEWGKCRHTRKEVSES